MKLTARLFLSFVFGSLMFWNAFSQAEDYRVQVITEGLNSPWSLAFLPEGGFLVTEKSGQLKQLDGEGNLIASISVDLPDLLPLAQGGLLEVMLLPDFSTTGELLFSYACGTRTANSVCLAQATLRNQQLSNITRIFRAQPDRRAPAHFGGRMQLLPDNTLILTLGDGFDYREEAQNPTNHLGKILRLTLDGKAPDDNPFVGKPGYAPEIYSLGHRNVQGIVFDAKSDLLFSHEHGPRGGDELNVILPGQNYGWPVATHGIDYTRARISPFTQFRGMVDPLYHWSPSIAPAGMTIYQGDLFPQWQGHIFIAALAAKRLYRLEMQGTQLINQEALLRERNQRLRDVRTGPDGAIYVLTDSAEGELLRLAPGS